MTKIELPNPPLRYEPIITVRLKNQVLTEDTSVFNLNCGENVRRPSSVYIFLMPVDRTIEDNNLSWEKNPIVFKPNNLNSVQIEFGGNERFPSDGPIKFNPRVVPPTPYGDCYERFLSVLGTTSDINAVTSIDYERYYKNSFVCAINTSLWGTDQSSVSPIDENLTGLI